MLKKEPDPSKAGEKIGETEVVVSLGNKGYRKKIPIYIEKKAKIKKNG